MTNAAFEKIGVKRLLSERVLWSHVQEKSAEPKKVSTRRFFTRIVSCVSLGGSFFQLFYSDFESLGAGLALVFSIIIAAGAFQETKTDLNYAKRRRPFQIVFMSCVITNKRILLRNFAGAPVTILDRSEINSIRADDANGSRGIVFSSSNHLDSFTFIGRIDHSPALAALDSTGHTP